jgi:hypothetical protein
LFYQFYTIDISNTTTLDLIARRYASISPIPELIDHISELYLPVAEQINIGYLIA